MRRKMTFNKRTVVLASSLAVIPLAAVIIATATHRRRRKSLQTSGFLGRTRTKASVITTGVDRQQQKEKSQAQLQPPLQGSEAKAVMATTATTTTTTIATKDITTPAVIPPPIEASDTSVSSVIVISSSQTSKEEEISLSDEARKAGGSLKELIITAINEAKDSAKGTGKRLKEQTINIAATADSKDIHSLGDNLNALVGLFEETMTEIRKERYDQQIKLLEGYKDLLKTHIKIVNARGRMASN